MKLWQMLRRPRAEVSRYTVDDYARWLTESQYGLMPLFGTGQRQALERPEASFQAYTYAAYKSDGIVFACMNKRMSVFTEARFRWQHFDPQTGRDEELFIDSALQLLEQPWPNGSSGELLARMIQDVDLCGNFYAVNEGDRLRRLRPDWVEIVLSAIPEEATDVDVLGYAYYPGGIGQGDPELFTVAQVAHWSPIPDPIAQYRGMSWLTPVIREIQADKAATKHKLQFFSNAATPNLAVSFKESVTPQQFKDFMAQMNAAHQGVDNAYKTMYLGGGADVTVVGADMRQLDFKATQGAGETRIAAAGGVHPVLVGLSEGLQGSSLNAGNYAAARRGFADGTMRPLWRSAFAALSTILTVPENARLWFDQDAVPFLREDAKDAVEIQQVKSTTIRQYIDAGFEWESVVKAVDNDDLSLLKHSGLYSVQLQEPGAQDEPEAEPAGDAERAFNPNQRRDARGRWTKGGGGVTAALKSGDDDALDDFSRETLRREAKRRGIKLPRGASIDEIKDALHDDEGGDSKSDLSPTDQVRDAYDRVRGDREWVGLAEMRKELSGLSRDEQDKAIKDLATAPGQPLVLVPEDNQKTLTPEDRAAAIRVGGEDKHLMQMDDKPAAEKAEPASKAPVAKPRPEPKPTKAMTPEATLAAAPKDVEGTGSRKIDKAGAAALERYRGKDFTEINGDLRSGKSSAKTKATVEQIDRVHAESKLTEDVVLHRGIGDIDRVFGAAAKKKLTGAEWQDDAFQSTTADADIAERFLIGEQGRRAAAVMKVRVPAGTGAIQLSDGNYEAEMLLERGLRMRVISDTGPWRRGQKGPRTIEVEVVPA